MIMTSSERVKWVEFQETIERRADKKEKLTATDLLVHKIPSYAFGIHIYSTRRCSEVIEILIDLHMSKHHSR